MGMLDGKRALILGVASNKSIAWGIAKAMHREGAEIALTYQNDRFRERVEKFAEELGSSTAIECDVEDDENIRRTFNELGKTWDSLDILVHSLAYAPREELKGEYLESVTREGFRIAHDISSYSLSALANAAKPVMKGRNGCILTLSYLGAVRTMPSYNVMGLAKASLEANVRYIAESLGPTGTRVNAISAGPIRTLASSGVKDMRKFLAQVEKVAPLRRNVTADEVGNAAAFICSDLASGITGEITYVDCGFNIMGTSTP
jgi:enoyl-[acyl-carrier protein] reductase I